VYPLPFTTQLTFVFANASGASTLALPSKLHTTLLTPVNASLKTPVTFCSHVVQVHVFDAVITQLALATFPHVGNVAMQFGTVCIVPLASTCIDCTVVYGVIPLKQVELAPTYAGEQSFPNWSTELSNV